MRQNMSRYRRNGTPIGPCKVYAVSPGKYVTKREAKVWSISGYKTWEEAESGFAFEVMTGAFGFGDRVVLVHPWANLQSAMIENVSMPSCNLSNADLVRSNLTEANFENAKMVGVKTMGASMNGTFFHGADMTGSYLMRVDGLYANFEDANLSEAKFDEAYLKGASFARANLHNASFRGADLRETDFGRKPPERCNFEGAARREGDSALPGWRVVDGRLRRR